MEYLLYGDFSVLGGVDSGADDPVGTVPDLLVALVLFVDNELRS